MPREQVSIVLASKPNYDDLAFKYFLLSLNKIQDTFEFSFLDTEDKYVYTGTEGEYDSKKIKADYQLPELYKKKNSLDTRSGLFDGNYIINIVTFRICESEPSEKNGRLIKKSRYLVAKRPRYAWVSTYDWERHFSPPSLFEYLIHAIMRAILSINGLKSHEDTFGCCRDFTRERLDTKGDITIGYICDKHLDQLTQLKGEKYKKDVLKILDRGWIGSKTEIGSVAYNLMRVFRFDLDRDSGFNKTLREKLHDQMQDISKQVTISVAAGVIIGLVLALLTHVIIPSL